MGEQREKKREKGRRKKDKGKKRKRTRDEKKKREGKRKKENGRGRKSVRERKKKAMEFSGVVRVASTINCVVYASSPFLSAFPPKVPTREEI